jgi:Restriction endonuclease
VSSEIEDLHETLFGFLPAKQGTAYERLTAIVLATRGWVDVMHDTTSMLPDKLAGHQLDVTGRLPSGEIERLIVECKHKGSDDVGQDVLDHLVGVLAQVDADAAAVITTRGFTSGALAVAADEDIALLRLRPFDPENPEPYVKTISLTLVAIGNQAVDVNIAVSTGALVAQGPFGVSTDTLLLNLDGSPAETLREVFAAQTAPIDTEPGRYPREIKFDGGRLFPILGSEPAPLAGISWTEVVTHSPHTTVMEAEEGKPMLILEQLDAQGQIKEGRIVIDRELYAWEIDPDGRVTERGSLAGESQPQVVHRRIE